MTDLTDLSDPSELEDRVARALHEGADATPDVGGLAGRARSRARARRRTRSRVVVGAVVLAVVAAVVPLAVLGGGDRPTAARQVEPDDGWRTVTRAGLTFEVPDDWGDEVFAGPCPPAADCFYLPPTVIADDLPGARDHYRAPRRSGEARVGEGWVADAVIDGTSLYVVAPSRAEAQRVMDTAYGGCAPTSGPVGRAREAPVIADLRTDGPAVLCRYAGGDLVDTVRLGTEDSAALARALQGAPVSGGGIACDGVDSLDGTATRVRFGEAEVWIGPDCGTGGVRDGTETRDLSDDVRAAALLPTRWLATEVDGVTVDLPSTWVRLDTGACRAGAVRFGPADTDPCATPAPVQVLGFRSALIDGPPGLEAGFVLAGDRMVSVGPDLDDEVARRILASARTDGEDPGDLNVPWVEKTRAGLSWQQPEGADVRVAASSGETVSCAVGGPRRPAAPVAGGRWRAAYCGDGFAVVTAPTQALADLVASTLAPT